MRTSPPATCQIRYTSLLHAGEHGGASLAEAVAPFILLAPRGLLQAFIQLVDLHVHAPDHLVEAVGLDDGAFDGMLLPFECL